MATAIATTATEPPLPMPLARPRGIVVTKRTDRSTYMFLIQTLIRPLAGYLTKAKKEYPAGSPRLEPHKKARKTCIVREREVEGIYIYDITPKDAVSEKYRKRLYYFAGGGWHMPASSDHWALLAEIVKRIPYLAVSLVSYPLAPRTRAPAAFPQLQKLYDTLLEEADDAGESVILAGDSAGGNIILCLTTDALTRDPTARVPIALMAISPSTDLARGNPDIEIVKKHDPILRVPFINSTATEWRGEWDASDVRVSPIHADMASLATRGVKVHGVVGGYDMLGPDAVLLREKCNDAAVDGEWLDWDKQMHVFPLTWTYHVPEGVQAKEWILDVLKRT